MRTIADIFYSKYKHVKNFNTESLRALLEREGLKLKMRGIFRISKQKWYDEFSEEMLDYVFDDESSVILDFKGNLLLHKHLDLFNKWFRWWIAPPCSAKRMFKHWKINRGVVNDFCNNNDTFEQFLKKQKRLIQSYVQSKKARSAEGV